MLVVCEAKFALRDVVKIAIIPHALTNCCLARPKVIVIHCRGGGGDGAFPLFGSFSGDKNSTPRFYDGFATLSWVYGNAIGSIIPLARRACAVAAKACMSERDQEGAGSTRSGDGARRIVRILNDIIVGNVGVRMAQPCDNASGMGADVGNQCRHRVVSFNAFNAGAESQVAHLGLLCGAWEPVIAAMRPKCPRSDSGTRCGMHDCRGGEINDVVAARFTV